jgi:hypothetical protein
MRRRRAARSVPFWLAPVLALSFGLGSGLAQQRPPAAEDPRPIPDRALDARLSLGWENRAVYSISGLEGEHLSLFPASIAMGIGGHAEFKIEGTVQDFLRSSGDWKHSVGDIGLSAKIQVLEEKGWHPALTFRNLILLPNANQASGIGLNTFRYFGSVLAGKTAGRSYFFGGVGAGILGDPVNAAAQQDVLTGNFAFRTALSPRWTATGEFNGMLNPRDPPAPGNDSRAEVRLGARLHTHRFDWDFNALGGLTRNDPRFGVAVSVTRRFILPGK